MPFTTTGGHSPVVISSSSPAAEPLTLDWTPPSHPPERLASPGLLDRPRHGGAASGQSAGDTTAASLSSPGLPSPSQLVKTKGSGVRPLPSGSRAQPAPTGAKLGFVSAASLARELSPIAREETVSKAKGSRKQATKPTKKDGNDESVKKPRKRATKAVVDEMADAGGQTSVKRPKKRDTASNTTAPEFSTTKTINFADFTADTYSDKAVKSAQKAQLKEAVVLEGTTPSISTKRTINFAEYAAVTDIVEAVEPAKKAPRKRAQKAKPAEQSETTTVPEAKTNGEADKEVKRPRRKPEKTTKLPEKALSVPSTTTEPQRAATSVETASNAINNATNQVATEKGESSNYFAQTVSNDSPTPAKAAVRRRSWTPVKDTEIVESEHADSHAQDDAGASPSVETPRVPLGELLANFAYSGAGANTCVPMERTNSGESDTKRRRVDSHENSVLSAAEKRKLKAAEKSSLVPKVPKPKAVKKKPQTITAVAMAAYHTSAEGASTTNNDIVVLNDEPSLQTATAVSALPPVPTISDASNKQPAKLVKPRKPRSKVNSDAKQPKAGKVTKKKGKAASKATDLRPPLYSPERAYNQMMQQEFLFGTSSQLAAPESPTFIRQMQYAMLESEAMQPSQTVTRVPNAPHGTCLSVGQGDRHLWRSAARDFKGGLHRDSSGLVRNKTTIAAAKVNAGTGVEPAMEKPVVVPAIQESEPTSNIPDEQSEFVDIDAIEDVQSKQNVETPKKNLVEQQVNPSPKWTHIDEISDDEPAATPSPPRRRANAPSPAVRTLSLSPSKSLAEPEVVSAPPLSTTAFLKSTDAQWAERAPVLFAKITAVIKKTPPSTDSASPSWHEKILLYDPIVLEDITSWLNEQNIRVQVIRQKKKTATKGRKKKADASADDQADHGTELETESIEEPLQAWMVQKWCEENSICCLWKDGLRGGVKTKY